MLSEVVALISKIPIKSSSSSSTYNLSSSIRGLASAARAGRTADPTVHAEDFDVATQGSPEGPDTTVANDEKPVEEVDWRRCRGTEPFSPPKPRYAARSPRLESTGVSQQPLDPMFQQKRRLAKTSLEDLSCAGLEDNETDRRADRNDQQEDEQEYYKNHKASPLSEITMADTRKPIDRATAHCEDKSGAAAGGDDVIGWKGVQLETAEETLLRAAMIFKENAMRGDTDAPQSKVLKRLLRARSGNPDSAPQ